MEDRAYTKEQSLKALNSQYNINPVNTTLCNRCDEPVKLNEICECQKTTDKTTSKFVDKMYDEYSNPNCFAARDVSDKVLARAKVGLKKYGISVGDRNDLSIQAWLTHLQEELMDACIYIQKLKKELGE